MLSLKKQERAAESANARILANVLELMPSARGSQARLAEEIGVTPVHMSYLMNEKRRFTMPVLASLSVIFDVDIARLFDAKPKTR
jgi:plasmid maintenance system antidote protein VapI